MTGAGEGLGTRLLAKIVYHQLIDTLTSEIMCDFERSGMNKQSYSEIEKHLNKIITYFQFDDTYKQMLNSTCAHVHGAVKVICL